MKRLFLVIVAALALFAIACGHRRQHEFRARDDRGAYSYQRRDHFDRFGQFRDRAPFGARYQ